MPIRIHFSLLLVLPYLVWAIAKALPTLGGLAGLDVSALRLNGYALGALLAVGLFACVLLHELAHVIVGHWKGGHFRAVTLMIVGGVADMEHLPRTPGGEALMAAAGPFASLLLAALSFGAMWLAPGVDARLAFFYLAQANLALALFNLVPALPMDGGRVLRALLAMVTRRVTATRIAAGLAQVLSALLFAVGVVMLNFGLCLVATLVFLGARGEAARAVEDAPMDGLTVADAMSPGAFTVDGGAALSFVLDEMRRQLRTVAFVVEEGVYAGLLSAREALRAESASAELLRARDLLRKDVRGLWPGLDLATAVRAMNESGLPTLPVVVQGRVVGMVSLALAQRAVRARHQTSAGALVERPT